MPSAKDIAELSATILGFTPLAPFAPIAGGVAKLLPGDDDDTKKKKLNNWKVKSIPEWKRKCRALMDIPMKPERKRWALEEVIWRDWWEFFGDEPKDSVVDELHRNVYRAVTADMATGGL